MDVAAPYESVVPSLDGPVLIVLARAGKPLTGSQIHQLSRRGSEQAVRNVLARLVTTGVVTTDLVGTSTVYVGNRNHVAWPAVEALAATGELLESRLRQSISAWEVRPIKAILFGSAARRDGDLRSDIDVLLVHRAKMGRERLATWERQVADLHLAVEDWTGNVAEFVTVDTRAWNRMVDHSDELTLSVAKDGIDLLS